MTIANKPPSKSKAQFELVMQHRALGIKMAKRILRIWRATIEEDELRSLTDLALCESAIKYSPDRGAQYSTFLYLYIRHHLIEAIKMRSKAAKQISSSDDFEYEGRSIEDICKDLNAVSPEEELLSFEAKEKCTDALDALLPLERKVVLEIVVNGEKVARFARELGYSRGHLSEVKTKALGKMKNHLSGYKEAA